jgi:hypothetical protein
MSFTARETRRKKQTQKNLFTYLVTILKTLLTQFCHCFLTTIHNYLQFLCSAKYYSFCFPSLKSLWQYRSWSFNLGISTTRYTTLGGFSKKLREKNIYRISSYSFRGNYSFLNLEIVANSNISIFYLINWIFAAETIQERKLFKDGNYMRKCGIDYFEM